MTVAIISDIHGNSIALKEIVSDIKKRAADMVLNLGDSLYGPLDPKETYDILRENNIISLSGNEDRIIVENLKRKSACETVEYVKSVLDKTMIEWLKNLPFFMVYNGIYCCHGTPQSDSDYLLEKIEKDRISIKSRQEIDSLLINVNENIVVCGHSHISNIVETNNKLVVNPGSVGLPAYDDDFPAYHKMQNYNPRASYAILDMDEESVSIQRYSIDYDYNKAAGLAMKNNRPDWAEWIRTGIA